MATAVVVFSGGPDSTAAILWSRQNGFEPHLLTFQFRQDTQDGEIRSAMTIASELDMPHTLVDMKGPMSVFGNAYPLMHGDARDSAQRSTTSADSRIMRFGAGVVLSLAAAFALRQRASTVVWGATKDDSGRNNQYTTAFAAELTKLVNSFEEGGVQILAPLADLHKFEIVKQLFRNQNGLFAATWSCLTAATIQCGKCHGCVARRLAALLANVADKTKYKEKGFQNPLTESEMKDTKGISKERWAELLASEKAIDV
jgi:7-cyano-7-deazaguanine synthase